MKPLLVLFGIQFAFLSLGRADDFSVNIAGKTTSSEAIKVGNAWRTDLPSRYRVTLRSSADVAAKDLVFKVYFFDAEGKVLRKQDGPSSIWTSTKQGTAEAGMPEALKGGQLSTVYVAIPPEVSKSKATLVLFGSADNLAYEVYPSSKKVEELDFPEKDKIKK